MTAALALIPHGGPAIAIFVGGLLCGVVAAVVAMETDRPAVAWAIGAFLGSVVVLSVVVDLLSA
jgi:hypothetical protein